MAKPSSLPDPWASAANYPAEVYPSAYPAGHPLAGQAHPLAGQAVPWSGQPTSDAAAEAAYAQYGHRPGKPLAAPAVNSREQKIDGWLGWVNDGTSEADVSAHIVETTAGGRVRCAEISGAKVDPLEDDYRELKIVGSVEQLEGRRSWHSHSEENDWMIKFRVDERTFCFEGTVPGNPYTVNNDITTSTTPDLLNRYYFAQFPSNCVVIFHYDVVTVIGDGLEIGNVVDVGSRQVQQVLTRAAGTWTFGPGGNNTDDIALVNGVQVLIWPKTGDATQLSLRATFDSSAQGFDYRIGARISARVVEMDP